MAAAISRVGCPSRRFIRNVCFAAINRPIVVLKEKVSASNCIGYLPQSILGRSQLLSLSIRANKPVDKQGFRPTCSFAARMPTVTLTANGNGHGIHTSQTQYSEGLSPTELQRKMQELTDKFIEARDLLYDAKEVEGTVYFAEDMIEACELVDSTLQDYKTLLEQLSETQRREVQRTVGLKMEELRAHKNLMEDEAKQPHT